MTIGKSYESTKIEVQEFSANRPPAKEGIKVVSKNKPKKVLMCNYSANNIGAHGFSYKGYKRNTQITNNQNHPRNNLY